MVVDPCISFLTTSTTSNNFREKTVFRICKCLHIRGNVLASILVPSFLCTHSINFTGMVNWLVGLLWKLETARHAAITETKRNVRYIRYSCSGYTSSRKKVYTTYGTCSAMYYVSACGLQTVYVYDVQYWLYCVLLSQVSRWVLMLRTRTSSKFT